MLKRVKSINLLGDFYKTEPKDLREVSILVLSGTVTLSQSIDDVNFIPVQAYDAIADAYSDTVVGPKLVTLVFGSVYLRVASTGPASLGIVMTDVAIPPKGFPGFGQITAQIGALQAQVTALGNFQAQITTFMASLPTSPPSTTGVWWNNGGVPTKS